MAMLKLLWRSLFVTGSAACAVTRLACVHIPQLLNKNGFTVFLSFLFVPLFTFLIETIKNVCPLDVFLSFLLPQCEIPPDRFLIVFVSRTHFCGQVADLVRATSLSSTQKRRSHYLNLKNIGLNNFTSKPTVSLGVWDGGERGGGRGGSLESHWKPLKTAGNQCI